MRTTGVVTVALPAGIARGGRLARMSVFLSPRLESDDPTDDRLRLWPELLDWPALVGPGRLGFQIEVEGGPTIPARIASEPPSSELWRSAFKRSTYVKPYRFPEELAVKPIVTYPAGEVLEYLKGRYQRTWVNSPTSLPSPVAHRRGLRELFALREALAPSAEASTDDLLDGELVAAREAARIRRERYGPEAYMGFEPPVIAGQRDEEEPAAHRAFRQFLLFHHRSPEQKDPTPLPSTRADRRRMLDFHAALSALGDHPALLRRLGLVIDLTFDPSALPDAGDIPGKLRAIPTWTPSPPQAAFHTPWTAYHYWDIGGKHFFAIGHRGVTGTFPEFLSGLVTLVSPDRWDLVEVDVDGAAFQAFGLVSNLFAQAQLDRRPIDDPNAEGLPALRTGGFSLLRTATAQRLNDTFSSAYAANRGIEDGTSTLFADDLTRGYRADVQGPRGVAWRSLHARSGRYSVDGGPAIPPVEDEGLVQRGITQRPGTEEDPDAEFRAHDALLRWTGWSLSVPRPGKALSSDPRAPDEEHPETLPQRVENQPIVEGIPLRAAYDVKPGTLPRLRFGAGYRMRLRAVDLAGNSLSVAEATDLLKRLAAIGGPQPVVPAPDTDARVYRRFEPLSSPELVPREDVLEGESLERLVIRSDHNMTAQQWSTANHSKDKPYGPVNERHIVPPKVSQLMAERHGAFDAAVGTGKAVAATYAIALKESGSLADKSVLDTRTGKHVSQRVQVVPSDAGNYVVNREEQLLVPYLPDPLVHGATFSGLPGLEAGTVSRFSSGALHSEAGPAPFAGEPEAVLLLDFGPRTSWPEPPPFRLRIAEGSGPPAWNASRRVLTVRLPKATRAKVRLSSHCDEDGLGMLGVWGWIAEAAAAGAPMPLDWYRQMALLGRLWPISPPRELTLVHAVQRPLAEPKILQLDADRRDAGSTHAYLRGEIRVDGKSTEKVDLQAVWVDRVDPAGEVPPMPPAAAPSDPPERRFEVPGHGHVLDVRVNLAADARPMPEPQPVDQVPAGEYDEEHDLVRLVAPARDDESRLTWLSRHEFGDTRHRRIRYYADATSRFREYFDPDLAQDSKNFTRRGPEVEVMVPSSARPAPPAVLYAVPTFGWERGKSSDPDVYTSVRRGNGLRIYLDRGWYSSGDGELLGVVLWPDWNCPAPERLAHSVTAWALDPIWRSEAPAATPDPVSFPLATRIGTDLRLERQRSEAKEAAAGGITIPDTAKDPIGVGPDAAEPEPVTVAGHEVHFDPDRGLWYCDVVVDAGPAYKPFVRLALARYQPCSLPGLELSRVVLADYAQLHPDRTVTVIREPDDPDLMNLAVTGRTYDSGSALYAANGDPEHGSVVEVGVEVRMPGVDDELAWSPVPDEELDVRADDGAFDSVLRWSGQVRLPAGRKKGDYRITVREYERFARIADDDQTAGESRFVPAGRLVFVETIEV